MPLQSKAIYKLASVAAVVSLVCAGLAHAEKAAQTPAQKDSVTTVDALVKLDNAAALEKATADAIKNGLIKPTPKAGTGAAAKPVEPPPVVRVTSISGIQDDLMVSLNINGQGYQNLRKGAPVRGCVVSEVKDRCVILAPAPAETVISAASQPAVVGKTKGKHAKGHSATASVPATRPEMCPTSCWTGVQPSPVQTGANGIGGPLPAGMPAGARSGPPVVQRPIIPAQPPVSQANGAGEGASVFY